MPGKRKEGKKLWGGYLESHDFARLDRCARFNGFATRTDFLVWFAQNCKELDKIDWPDRPPPRDEEN